MTSMPLSDQRSRALSAPARTFGPRLSTALARIVRGIAKPRPAPWFTLDERQLADIGLSPSDAEIARIERGIVGAGAIDPLASHGLTASELTRWVRDGRRR